MLMIKYFSFFLFLLMSCQGEINTEEKVTFQQENYKNHKRKLSSLVDSGQPFSIVIEKKKYKLTIIQNGEVLKEYPVVFGKNPVDDKRMEGDKCTPEGLFKIRDQYPHRKWNKFIWINYPTAASQQKFNQAKKNGEIPKNATIGGEIGIHGVPKGKDDLITSRTNWTWGCIAMKNKHINEIFPYTNKRTTIEIRQ